LIQVEKTLLLFLLYLERKKKGDFFVYSENRFWIPFLLAKARVFRSGSSVVKIQEVKVIMIRRKPLFLKEPLQSYVIILS
jgi:hypothetical protein